MQEYFLKVGRTKEGKSDLNRAYLSVWNNGVESVLINSIKHATKKGWQSEKPIFEELEIIDQESDYDLIITENCANMLIDKYAKIDVKVYDAHIPKISAAHAIANFITKNGTDPYDRG